MILNMLHPFCNSTYVELLTLMHLRIATAYLLCVIVCGVQPSLTFITNSLRTTG